MLIAVSKGKFCRFNVPVAKLVPKIFHQCACRIVVAVAVKSSAHFGNGAVEPPENPAVKFRQVPVADGNKLAPFKIAENVAACVPDFVCKTASKLKRIFVDKNVLPLSAQKAERKLKCVRAVFIDDFKRVNAVAERLAHLSALPVAHKPMNVDVAEGRFARKLQARHNHPRNPKENNIVGGNECRRRVERFKVGRFFRPAERGKGPKPRRKPRIKHVGILLKPV